MTPREWAAFKLAAKERENRTIRRLLREDYEKRQRQASAPPDPLCGLKPSGWNPNPVAAVLEAVRRAPPDKIGPVLVRLRRMTCERYVTLQRRVSLRQMRICG
jgi:hypothetical protein